MMWIGSIHFFLWNFILNFWRCTIISDLMINEQIRDREIRLIDQDGNQAGVVLTKDALQMAKESELDLVKISPNAKPPVCKIINYGKFKFDQTKKDKEARKKQKTISVKEVRLSPNIEQHDIDTKMKNASKFLSKGDKVKVSVRFRGRELAHTNTGRKILIEFAKGLSEIADVDVHPKMEGRSMVMFMVPKN